MSEDRDFARPLHIAAVAVLVLVAECMLVRAFLDSDKQVGIPLALHFGVVGALCLWHLHSPALRADVRLPLLLICTTAALGPVGPAGTLVTIVLARWYMRRARPFEEWYRTLFPETIGETGDEFARQAAHSDLDNPNTLAPFTEVLAFGTLHQRQALITLIDQSFRPAFGPILKRALADTSNAIRVQAATAMNKIEDRMHADTLRLTRRLNDDPADADALRALAQHYDQCVYSRILDARREEETRERALDAYRRYIAARPQDVESRIAIGRLLLRGGQHSEAADWLEKTVGDGASTSEAELWYMESLYNLGRFDELRAYTALRRDRIEGASNIPSNALGAVRLWASASGVPFAEAPLQ